MTEFFRRCPECGKRFHVKLESKELVAGHREEFSSGPMLHDLRELSAGIVAMDIDEYQYKYKCQLCGHEWSEKRIEDEPESKS